MSNFVETYKQGKLGKNFGLTTGISALDKAINGLQKKTSIGLAAAPKVGKTTLADFAFVIAPYLQMEKEGRLNDIDWIYLSYEIDRISKEFKYASYFMAEDFNVYNFDFEGKMYTMNQDYLMGRLLHENEDGTKKIVQITEEHELMLKEIYYKRIVPMFGEYDDRGIKIKKGKIDFIEDPENPTGLYKYMFKYANENGIFSKEKYWVTNDQHIREEKERIIGYKEKNPDKFTIIITDHIRKFRKERGFSMKENIDKWLEYTTWFRNMCLFTFINISHSNRGIANVDRLKFAGEWVFPTADDVKDTGNLAEESTILMTLFNPGDEKYNLKKHFGVELANFPNYRSLHITESRYTECPVHIQLNMLGGVNTFTSLVY